MTILDRIKELTKSRDKTVKEVAIELGLGENYLYSLKNKIPNGQTLQKLADYFHVSVDYLLGRDETEPENQTVDMAKSAISRYFNFSREFPLNRADDFARVLGISTEYLLGISKDEMPNKTKKQSPIVEEINKISSQLEEPRQKIVLETANVQLKEQEEQKSKIVSIKNEQEKFDLADLIDFTKYIVFSLKIINKKSPDRSQG